MDADLEQLERIAHNTHRCLPRITQSDSVSVVYTERETASYMCPMFLRCHMHMQSRYEDPSK
jgi:hypothetical protein